MRDLGDTRGRIASLPVAVRGLLAALCLHFPSSPAIDARADDTGVADTLVADTLARGEAAYARGSFEHAAALWRPLAEDGEAFAQFGMGLLYFSGEGVERDLEASTRWFRLAAEQGYGPAQFNLGNAYKHGRGVLIDEAQAAHWWRLAAEQDYATAQYNLALQYYYGLGVDRDEHRAGVWMREAADNGHRDAIALLGSSIEQDPEPAGGESSGRSQAPARVATPAPAAPGQQVLREAWIAAQDPAAYTLQLLASRSEESLVALLERQPLSGPTAYFRFERDGAGWLALVHGAYGDRAAARAAIETLPAALRSGPPWIRSFKAIQALIESR